MQPPHQAGSSLETPTVFGAVVRTEARLREIVPAPSAKITSAKVQHRLDPHCAMFFALSPYLVMATSDSEGCCDCSPRGGTPGFVKVLDDRHLLIPELSGNRRADTLRNLIQNPEIGLMVLIPGYEDFLRVNGEGWVVEDPAVLAQAAVLGAAPNIGIGVRIREAYMHCAKAAKRSRIWNSEDWPNAGRMAEMAVILRDHTRGSIGDGSVEAIQKILDDSYSNRLFTSSKW